jgi:hypothetical protein
LIAWSLDESLRGDMLGNLGKWIMGTSTRTNVTRPTQKHERPMFHNTSMPDDNPPGSDKTFKFNTPSKKQKGGGHKRLNELQRKFHSVDPDETQPKIRTGRFE